MIASSHGTPPLLMLGLPYLANNELLKAARRLGATVPRSGRNRLRRPQSPPLLRSGLLLRRRLSPRRRPFNSLKSGKDHVMRFKRWPRVEAYQETPRNRAAIIVSQQRQRDKLPLLADLIADEQPSIDAVIEGRQERWPRLQRQTRDQRAAKWREARRELAAYSLITRHAIRRLWNNAPYPADPTYLADFLLQIERREVDPFCRAPWSPSDDEIAEGRRRLAIATLRPFGVSSAMPSRESECAASTPDRARKIRSFGLVTAGDGG